MATVRSAFHATRLAAIAAVLFSAARQPVDAASFVKMVGSRTRGVSTVANSATTVNAPSNGVAAGDKAKFDAFTQEAVQRCVFGAPSYVYRDEIFWGQDRLDFLDRALGK